jgi:hypothetical protein
LKLEGLPSAEYRLLIGIYSRQNGERLAARGAAGQSLADNAVEVWRGTLP